MLRESLARMRTQSGFEVWVTHMFVLQDLVGQGISSAEALVLRAGAGAGASAGAAAGAAAGAKAAAPEVLGRWRLPA
jgi:hypothetical protein